MSEKVEKHKVVSLTYVIVDLEAKVLEQVDMPVDYIHGIKNDMFAKVEKALEGRGIGEEVTVLLEPQEGFGEVDPLQIFQDQLQNLPPEYRHIGATAEIYSDSGKRKHITVTNIDGDDVTIDANHPLAGKTIKFIITIQGIRKATEQELSQGEPLAVGNSLLN